MKLGRFLITLTAGVTAFSSVTLASDMLSVSGQARTRLHLEDNKGLTDTDFTEYWNNRVYLNLDVTPMKGLMVRLSPHFSHQWGGANTWTAQEAYMSWMASDMITLILGRQILSYGNELVIGPNWWNQQPQSFDAARVRLTYRMGTTDLFFAKRDENTPNADHDLYGMYTSLRLGNQVRFIDDLDVYAMWDDMRGHGATRSRMGIFGARIDGAINMVDYNLEATGEFGKANGTDVKGLQADATAGFKLMNHHLALNIVYANSEYKNPYGTTHDFLGHADIVNRNNILAFALLTNWVFNNRFKLAADLHYFMKAKKETYNETSLGATAAKRNLGFEGNVVLSYLPEKMLSFDLGYNLFKPLAALDKVGFKKMLNEMYVQGTMSF